jgi:hypothetical protein
VASLLAPAVLYLTPQYTLLLHNCWLLQALADRYHCVLKAELPRWPLLSGDTISVWRRHDVLTIQYGPDEDDNDNSDSDSETTTDAGAAAATTVHNDEGSEDTNGHDHADTATATSTNGAVQHSRKALQNIKHFPSKSVGCCGSTSCGSSSSSGKAKGHHTGANAAAAAEDSDSSDNDAADGSNGAAAAGAEHDHEQHEHEHDEHEHEEEEDDCDRFAIVPATEKLCCDVAIESLKHLLAR